MGNGKATVALHVTSDCSALRAHTEALQIAASQL